MQNRTPTYTKHFTALSSLYILACGVITLPAKSANRFTLLGFLIAGLITIFLCLILLALYRRNICFKIAVIVLAMWCIGETFYEFCDFVSLSILPETPKIFIYLIFGAVSLYMCLKNDVLLLKFSLISFVFCTVALIAFFFITLKDFKISNIFISNAPKLNTLAEQALPYLKKFTLPSLILPIYSLEAMRNVKKKTLICGLLSGMGILLLCILNSLLLFGAELSSEMPFPYAAAISTATFGSLFSRLDGFAYLIYFSACLIKTSTCVSVIKKYYPRALESR